MVKNVCTKYSSLMLKKYFKEYYFRSSDKIRPPSKIEMREFGYLPFEGSMVRHLSFKDIGSLRALLVKRSSIRSVLFKLSV